MWEGACPLPHLFWWIAAQVLADDHRRKLHHFQRVGQVDECESGVRALHCGEQACLRWGVKRPQKNRRLLRH